MSSSASPGPAMTTTRIETALAGADQTRAVVMGVGALHLTGATFREHLPGMRAVILADENTWEAAGPGAQESLRAAGVDLDEPVVFPGRPVLFADDAMVLRVRDILAATDAAAVSVGSGSMNDVVKNASDLLDRPYLSVCTAASVDGYTAEGAAITVKGVKSTVSCRAPIAVVAPIDVMAAAPSRLTATGLGDLFEKVPAGADWMVADALGVEPVDWDVWDLVQGPLQDAIADPDGLRRGDVEAVAALSEGLQMSGLAIQVHGTSRPASGAGHYFSHQWEMEGYGRDWAIPLSHGFKVGLGKLAMCALYEIVLGLDLSSLNVEHRLHSWPTPEEDRARVEALQPIPVIRESAVRESAAKYLSRDEARHRLETLKHVWPELRFRLAQQLMPASEVEDILRRVGAIHHPSQIGISLEELRTTYLRAQTIRARYTVLDTLQEAGLLTTVVDRLFAPGGYWYGRSPEPRWTEDS
ncbi:MAG TPA: sn-glycerol-1-phosphate dehydrogenase [Propionibacteriaceae bacterium]|nr:sn-glycerol-1-phosphate dehydrogenase [Propionibacteriaceae bacterium]